ncbi:hypothetical protein HUJ05_008938 [Dendroctonus ponderosae]|nr:hypothetical protein HUJ05_008938 [Dendroctonus ponderosae]
MLWGGSKNILDKFNPGARQMINAGKAYLKALHSAAAASRMYVDAISKLAKQAQQGTWGGSSDIGAALMRVVEVYKDIQDQQMNILKAFYVDLLVPLETNLEKDTKVVQSEQKRFLQQHKQRSETYSKAAALMKKQRKKSRGSTKAGLAMDKELKNMQVLEEEKTKLDSFCEQSLKNAMTQERRRYGFVLERQCSLAKHYLSYHAYGADAFTQNLEKWSEVAKTREYLPESVENIFSNRIRQISVWQDEDLYSNPRSPNFDEDRISINSQLRKTKSMDASCLDIRSMAEVGSPVNTLSRAKSEYNLNSSNNGAQENNTPSRRPKSMAVPPPPTWEAQLARALYAYLSSGENQLSFHEGDLIALIGERNKGWQFGENLRTQCSGWFPLAYTEILIDDSISNDSGFSNDPPPQPEIDYSDDDSVPGQTKLSSRKSRKETPHETNANNARITPKTPQPRHRLSNSHGNLMDNRYLTSDESEVSKVKVKRTKSFWKFGKNSSDSEILEGMALWRHRDLVDLNDENNKKKINSQERVRRPSRDQSNDSDKTINNNDQNNTVVERPRKEINKVRESFKDKPKLSLPSRREEEDKPEDEFEDIYGETGKSKYIDQFLDDDGDGLMLKTVNRRNILKQYSDDLTAEDSDSASEMTSDDPYDCIVVDDQKVKRRDGQFPNVAEIGKKLEKLSKTSKYSPNKSNNSSESQLNNANQIRNSIREKNEVNIRRNKSREKDPREYHPEQRSSFKTFGIDNDNSSEKERFDDQYYIQERSSRVISKEVEERDTNRNRKAPPASERRSKPSYESINSEMNNRNQTMDPRGKEPKVNGSRKEARNKYYDSTNDELSDVGENRQFLPRTKLSKTNSGNSKYDENISLMEYGETLQKRLKNPEFTSKYDDKSGQNGNMYGPWYDLWGLDASTRK